MPLTTLVCFPLSAAQVPFPSHADPTRFLDLWVPHTYPSSWSSCPTKPTPTPVQWCCTLDPCRQEGSLGASLRAMLCISYLYTLPVSTQKSLHSWASSGWPLHIHFVTVWIGSVLCKGFTCWRFGPGATNCSVVEIQRSDCTSVDIFTHGFITWWHYWWRGVEMSRWALLEEEEHALMDALIHALPMFSVSLRRWAASPAWGPAAMIFCLTTSLKQMEPAHHEPSKTVSQSKSFPLQSVFSGFCHSDENITIPFSFLRYLDVGQHPHLPKEEFYCRICSCSGQKGV